MKGILQICFHFFSEWEQTKFFPKITALLSSISMLKKDGFKSKPKTIIFSTVFLVSHILVTWPGDQLCGIYIQPWVCWCQERCFYSIFISTQCLDYHQGLHSLSEGDSHGSKLKMNVILLGFFFHLDFFSDDLRATGDTRGACRKILMKTWQFWMKTEYHSSFPIIFFLVIVEKFIVFFCTWEISSSYHYISPFRLNTGRCKLFYVSLLWVVR